MARPRKKFTTEQENAIEQMAKDNCHFDTIAMALGIAKNTLKRHFGPFIIQKRAEGRTKLRRTQRELSKKNPAMAIFLGKNELEQKDSKSHEVTGKDGEPIEFNMTVTKTYKGKDGSS